MTEVEASGPYWGTMSLGEVVNMHWLAQKLFTLGRVWGHAPPGNLNDFRSSEAHSGAF